MTISEAEMVEEVEVAEARASSVAVRASTNFLRTGWRKDRGDEV